MKSKHKTSIFLALAVLLLLASVPGALAQSGGQYDLTWNTVDGGGAVGAGSPGPYTLNGTAGQPDAAVWRGGDYVITGGFWRAPGAAGGGYSIYLPLVLRNY